MVELQFKPTMQLALTQVAPPAVKGLIFSSPRCTFYVMNKTPLYPCALFLLPVLEITYMCINVILSHFVSYLFCTVFILLLNLLWYMPNRAV